MRNSEYKKNLLEISKIFGTLGENERIKNVLKIIPSRQKLIGQIFTNQLLL